MASLFQSLMQVAAGLAVAAVTATRGAPVGPPLNEYQIKAAAFYNVIEFTNWPADAFRSPAAPLVVGILGEGPLATLIEQLVNGDTWRGRAVVVEHFRGPDDVKPCHVLFVARSHSANWESVRAQFSHRPVLCVSDGEDFAAQGGNVQLAIDRNKLRIFVNLAVTRANKIQLSSNLLHLATIVGPSPELIDTPRSGFRLPPTLWISGCLAVLTR